jgi:NAD(P)-dependent dehydrogenase (short-subunit alcohol dehydrogenase family)
MTRSPNGSLKDKTVLVVGRAVGLAGPIVSIAALGERLGTVDHVVCAASALERGRIADLDRDAIRLSFETTVIGPLMLTKHLAPRMRASCSP